MKEFTDRMFAPIVGVVTSLISWEAFASFLISLLVAFAGGFLAHAGKLCCTRIFKSKKQNEEIDE
jgi:hypothetical protein